MTPEPAVAAQCREMTRLEYLLSRVGYWFVRLRRKLPYLIWYDDETDVTITFSRDKLNQDDPFRSLFGGELYEAEKHIRAMGVSFDTGCGMSGRDWEWDFSLKGPVSVRFRGRAARPERRKETPRPRLIFSAPPHPGTE